MTAKVPISCRISKRLTRVIWFVVLLATVACWAIVIGVQMTIEKHNLAFAIGASPGGHLFISPNIANAALWMLVLLWFVTCFLAVMFRKQRIWLVAGLVAALPAGFVMGIWLGFRSPAPINSIIEKDGRHAYLGIDPAWDVRAYVIYDSVWLGSAWRERRQAEYSQSQTFWKYPYEGEMRLGLDRNGHAEILNPSGDRRPFPDGLNTFACPAGSPPGCVKYRN